MKQTLKDRIESYKISSDLKLLPRLPIIIELNGRNFSKLTSLLNKPYDPHFTECLLATMLRLCSEIEGCVFGYAFNDEIILVLRNDQTLETSPWYDNKLQKICSVASSIATLHFEKYASSIELHMMGDPLFSSQVYVVPNVTEATNTIIFKQQHNFYLSVQSACFYQLLKSYDKTEIHDMLMGLTIDDKINLLQQECQIDFQSYPSYFRRGTGCYKIPKIEKEIIKNKWLINSELPIFTQEQTTLYNILKNGVDIFREENI